MEPRTFLRLEGLTVLGLVLAGYFIQDGPVWLLVVLTLAPDISMLGYLVGARFGSWCYNVVHTYTVPLTIGALGYGAGLEMLLLISLVWIGHIGADRFFGYGLKFESGFKDTHLSAQPAPLSAFVGSDQ